MSAAPASARWNDLGRRIGSGAVLVALGAALIASSGLWLIGGLALLLGGLMWELARLTGWRHPEFSGARHALRIAVVAGVAFGAMMLWSSPWLLAAPILPIILGWAGTHDAQRPAFVGFTLAFFIAAAAMDGVREASGLATALWLVAVVVQSDVLGYFVGRIVGGPKFWPAVSPKKTWSGTAAGWVGAAVLGVILMAAGYADWRAVVIGPAIALAGQMGDIAESWLKRRVGVKDSSDLIPGHGGLMDRFDAMTGALIAAWCMAFLGLLPYIAGL